MVSFHKAWILAGLVSCASAQVNFLTQPSPRWSIQLRDSGKTSGRGMRQGNAIVAHKNGGKIVATANDGSLHIVQTKNTDVKTLAVFEPKARAGATTECISAATIVYADEQKGLFVEIKEEKDNKDNKDNKDKDKENKEEEEMPEPEMKDFIVYAVVEKKGDNLADTSSRIIAVDMEGNLKWSYSLSGRIEGSPVVGKSGIYVTTNDNGMGVVSVLKLSPEDGSVELSASVGAYAALGPPSLRQPAMNQNGNNNEDAGDFVIVAESWDSGFSETQGGLYMIPEALLTTNRDDKERDGVETEASGRFEYKLSKISSWAFSAIAPPMVIGDSIYVGAAGANVGGFTGGNRRNDLSGIEAGEDEISPQWEVQLSQNQLNASQRKLFRAKLWFATRHFHSLTNSF